MTIFKYNGEAQIRDIASELPATSELAAQCRLCCPEEYHQQIKTAYAAGESGCMDALRAALKRLWLLDPKVNARPFTEVLWSPHGLHTEQKLPFSLGRDEHIDSLLAGILLSGVFHGHREYILRISNIEGEKLHTAKDFFRTDKKYETLHLNAHIKTGGAGMVTESALLDAQDGRLALTIYHHSKEVDTVLANIEELGLREQ